MSDGLLTPAYGKLMDKLTNATLNKSSVSSALMICKCLVVQK